jgi:hypothetical protein
MGNRKYSSESTVWIRVESTLRKFIKYRSTDVKKLKDDLSRVGAAKPELYYDGPLVSIKYYYMGEHWQSTLDTSLTWDEQITHIKIGPSNEQIVGNSEE